MNGQRTARPAGPLERGRPATRAIWVLVVLGAAWIAPGLFGREPWKPDEGYTIGLVQHIIDSGDWIVPTLTGIPFMEKPPIFFATAALLGKAFSPWLMPLHQAMALAAALYLALLLVFAFLAGRETGGAAMGGTAVLALLGAVGLVVRAHSAITDMALCCGFAVACHGMILSARRRLAGAFWFGTGVGLAFMAKGFFGPVFLVFPALLLAAFGPAAERRKRAGTLAWAFVFSLPWLLLWPGALYLRSPEQFGVWFWNNNVGRYLGPAFGFPALAQSANPLEYLEQFPWFTLPLWPPALWLWWTRRRAALADPAAAYLTLTVLAGLAILSFASTRRELYIIPFLIPLALLAAQAGPRLPAWLEWPLARLPAVLFGIGLAGTWAFWLAWQTGVSTALNAKIDAFAPGFAGGAGGLALGLAALYTTAWIWSFLSRRRAEWRRDWAWVWGAGLTALWGAGIFLFLPALDYVNGYRPTFAKMAEYLPAGREARLESVRFGESQRAILEYYFRWKAPPLDDGGGEASGEYLVVGGWRDENRFRPDARWTEIWSGTRPGDEREWYQLYKRNLGGGGAAADHSPGR